jgi:chromosome segregation ATPase
MDWLRLGIGIAIAIAIAAAVASINAKLEDHYQAPIKAQMEAERTTAKNKLDACTVDKDTALNANVTLQGNLNTLKAEIARINALLERMRSSGDSAKREAEKSLAAAQDRLKRLNADNFDLAFVLTKPDPGGTCEQRMARIDDILRGLGNQRVRDHPAKAGGSKQGGNRDGKGSDPGAVRIVQ